MFSIDLETTILNPIVADIVGISISIKANEGFYIPILFPEDMTIQEYDLDLVYILNSLKEILESADYKKCGQNIGTKLLAIYGLVPLRQTAKTHKKDDKFVNLGKFLCRHQISLERFELFLEV